MYLKEGEQIYIPVFFRHVIELRFISFFFFNIRKIYSAAGAASPAELTGGTTHFPPFNI